MDNKNSGDNPSVENSKDNSYVENPKHIPSAETSEGTSSVEASEDTSSAKNSGSSSSGSTYGSTSTENTSSTSSNIFSDINSCINTPLSAINNINSLKNALCELPLDPCEQKFISTNITPLLGVADLLGRLAYNLAYSTNVLTNSPIVKPKRHKLKETINTVYNINEQCQDIYDVIEERVDAVLKGKC